jgi:mevalonate kinase
VPVSQVRAKATVSPNIHGNPGVVIIEAPDMNLTTTLAELPEDDPIRAAIWGLMAHLQVDHLPACTLKIRSTIPIAAGLGSGTSVSVAIIRAFGGFLGQQLTEETVSKLTYEVEKIHHGTPSGIDNTVVTYARPVYFKRGHPIETFHISVPFTIVIGDTGIRSSTKTTVSDVRAAWKLDPSRYNRYFSAVGSIVKTARQVIEGGHPQRLGPLMDENHQLLQEMKVSSPELDRLISAAKAAGALGAKLSGGGRGGNMIALAGKSSADAVADAIVAAGAVNTITTEVT